MNQLGWIDTNRCEDSMHLIGRNDKGRLVVYHSDESECEVAEYDIAFINEE